MANQAHHLVSIGVGAGHTALVEYNSIGLLLEPAGSNMVSVGQFGKKVPVVHILGRAGQRLGRTMAVGI